MLKHLKVLLFCFLVSLSEHAFCGETQQATGRAWPLELSLTLSQERYVIGETASVLMKLRNRGALPVNLPISAPWSFGFEIFDSSGYAIGLWSEGKPRLMAPLIPTTPLGPGEAISRLLRWDLSVLRPESLKALPPGRYGLEGFFGEARNLRQQGDGRIQTYPLVPLRTSRLFVIIEK